MSLELSILRNKLYASHFSENEEKLLDTVMSTASDWNSVFSDLIVYCLNNIRKDVSNGDFESALAEAQLIHNLPTSVLDVPNWDERHFFLYGVRSYLNKVKDFNRVRKVIVLSGSLASKN